MRFTTGSVAGAATALLAVMSASGCSSSHTSPSGSGGSAPTGAGTGGATGAGAAGATGAGAAGAIGGSAGAGGGAAGGTAGAGIAGAGGMAGQVGAGAMGGSGMAGAGVAGGGPGGLGGSLGAGGAPGADCSPLFTYGGSIAGTALNAPEIMLGNLTGHGKRDLIVADNQKLLTFVNSGAGQFTLRGSYDIPSRITFDVTAGDLNGDGFDDVVVVLGVPLGQIPSGPPILTVFLNGGDGTLAATTYSLPDAGQSVVLGDLDGDQLPDVLVQGSRMTFVLPNAGAGKLGTPVVLPVDVGPTAIADLDGDGKQDLLVNVVSGLEVVLNQGGLAFSPKAPTMLGVPLGFNIEQFMPLDVNGDKALDVVALGRVPMIDLSRRTLAVALNDGTGTLGLTFTAKVRQDTGGLTVGDFDHDGRLDLAVASPAVNGIDYFLATSSSYVAGGCRSSTVSALRSSLKSLAAGDVNGDGKADLSIATDSGVGLLFSAAP